MATTWSGRLLADTLDDALRQAEACRELALGEPKYAAYEQCCNALALVIIDLRNALKVANAHPFYEQQRAKSLARTAGRKGR